MYKNLIQICLDCQVREAQAHLKPNQIINKSKYIFLNI